MLYNFHTSITVIQHYQCMDRHISQCKQRFLSKIHQQGFSFILRYPTEDNRKWGINPALHIKHKWDTQTEETKDNHHVLHNKK